MSQHVYNPANYNFTWTDGWYAWDSKAAHKAALSARNAKVKELRAAGRIVRPFTLSGQLITRGGIGSGKPEITMFCSCYGLNVA